MNTHLMRKYAGTPYGNAGTQQSGAYSYKPTPDQLDNIGRQLQSGVFTHPLNQPAPQQPSTPGLYEKDAPQTPMTPEQQSEWEAEQRRYLDEKANAPEPTESAPWPAGSQKVQPQPKKYDWSKPYHDAISARANTASPIAKQAAEQQQSVRNQVFRTKLASWYGMYKQAKEDEDKVLKPTTFKLRHFTPVAAGTGAPSILGEAVGLSPDDQVKANWNAVYQVLGRGAGAGLGAFAGGALGGGIPGGILGGLGGYLLGDYLSHKAIQGARDLGEEADYRPAYLLPFTGANQAVTLAGASNKQQNAAVGQAVRQALGGGIVGVPLGVVRGLTGIPADIAGYPFIRAGEIIATGKD